MERSSLSWNRQVKQRVGFGTPPWGPCSCCMPRLMAFLCWPCMLFCGSCRNALRYDPPKTFSIFGCFWIQVHTKLQERLIQGLFFSVAYCVFYLATLIWLLEHYNEVCRGFTEHYDRVEHFKACALELVGKSMATLALICYIPSLAICL